MTDKKRDHKLGMDRSISRRDFLNGVALTVGGALIAPTTSPPTIIDTIAFTTAPYLICDTRSTR